MTATIKTNIRIASSEDAEFIAQSQVNMALETEQLKLDWQNAFEGVKAVFINPERGFYIIAEADSNRVGCLLITPEWSDWRNAWVWWIQSVFVIPEMRKSGIFGMMYAFIKQIVLQRSDISGIRLYVDNSNNSARRVYTRIGMNGDHYSTFEWMKDN